MSALPLPPELAIDEEPFDDDDLGAYLANDGEEGLGMGVQDPHVVRVGSFVIDNDEKAEWAARRWSAIDGDIEQARAQAAAWKARIDADLERKIERLEPRRTFFENVLKAYAIARRAADDRNATTSLPSATITTRSSKKPVVHVGNEEAVIAWALHELPPPVRDKVVKTTRKAMVMELRKVVAVMAGKGKEPRVVYGETGEIVPGCWAAPAGEVTATVSPVE